jgi:hypothetical protein
MYFLAFKQFAEGGLLTEFGRIGNCSEDYANNYPREYKVPEGPLYKKKAYTGLG